MIDRESIKEIAAIAGGSVVECYRDTVAWIGKKVAELDEWLCDYGDD